VSSTQSTGGEGSTQSSIQSTETTPSGTTEVTKQTTDNSTVAEEPMPAQPVTTQGQSENGAVSTEEV
jgi:hypothetical protein